MSREARDHRAHQVRRATSGVWLCKGVDAGKVCTFTAPDSIAATHHALEHQRKVAA